MDRKERILGLLASDRTRDEQVICTTALRAILDGRTTDRVALVTASGLAPEKVDSTLAGLIERGLIVMHGDGIRVVGSWGLSVEQTKHRLVIRGRDLFTWCAADATGIPAALGENAAIFSDCHQCGAPVNIDMVAGRVSRVEPDGVRAWLVGDQVGRSVVGFT